MKMDKKGFTLLEILGVITILGILLVIAVPRINNIIDNARINAHIQNEATFLRAARTFATVNNHLLPSNVGGTREIRLSDLRTNNKIDVIRDPNNRNIECSGYVLVTRLENNQLDFTPHLKCGNQNWIDDSTEDGLVLHYKFDDFQEPTENLFANLNLGVHSQGGLTYQYLGIEDNWLKFSISGTGTSDTYPYTFNISPRNIHSDFPTSFSFKYRTNVRHKYLEFSDPRMVNIHYKPGMRREDRDMGTHREAKLENVSPLQTVGGVPIVGESAQPIYFLSRPIAGMVFNPATDFLYFSDVQVEIKEYSTQYTVPGIRTGVIRDHSINNNHATLQMATTPRWAEIGKVGTGAYSFDGLRTINTNYDLSWNGSNQVSISFWLRPNNITDVNRGIIGKRFSAYEWAIYQTSAAISFVYWDNIGGHSNGMDFQTNNVLTPNQWTHFIYTWNGLENRIYINGNLTASRTATNPALNMNNLSPVMIGGNIHTLAWSDSFFRGSIDDVRFYSRALSAEEVRQLYNSQQ